VDFVSADATGGACTIEDGVVTCSFGDMPVGSSITATILLNPTQTGTITNMASVAGAEFEFDVTDNNIISITQVALDADLSLTITASTDPGTTGNQLKYFLTVMNNGTNPAPNVVLTDRLPDTVNFISASATQGTCTNHNDGIVNCDLGLLNAGDSVVAIVTVSPSVTGAITNTTTVTSDIIDLNLADNIFSVVSLVSSVDDLFVAQTATPDPVLVDGNLVYSITVTNRGFYPVPAVTVVDGLPDTVRLVSARASQGTCINAAGIVTCTLGQLGKGASATITILAIASTTGVLTNRVTVNSPTSAPTNPDLTSELQTSVITTPTISFERAGNRLLLSWPRATGNFVLEAADDLFPPKSWSAAKTPVEITEERITTTVKLSGTARFYRLKRQ
jgi:uncharacterized repeat protein (TIGR01451 family)